MNIVHADCVKYVSCRQDASRHKYTKQAHCYSRVSDTCADNWDTGDGLLFVHSRQLHIAWVVGNVHEGGVDHLVVDSVLCTSTHTSRTRIQIIDEQTAHLALLDDVRCLPATPQHMESKRNCMHAQRLKSTNVHTLMQGHSSHIMHTCICFQMCLSQIPAKLSAHYTNAQTLFPQADLYL